MTTITTTILPRVTADNAEWMTLKAAATALQALQEQDGSIADSAAHSEAASLVATVTDAIAALAPHFPPTMPGTWNSWYKTSADGSRAASGCRTSWTPSSVPAPPGAAH